MKSISYTNDRRYIQEKCIYHRGRNFGIWKNILSCQVRKTRQLWTSSATSRNLRQPPHKDSTIHWTRLSPTQCHGSSFNSFTLCVAELWAGSQWQKPQMHWRDYLVRRIARACTPTSIHPSVQLSICASTSFFDAYTSLILFVLHRIGHDSRRTPAFNTAVDLRQYPKLYIVFLSRCGVVFSHLCCR